MEQLQSIRLQGVGWGKGTPAEEIKPGDKLMWNYGYLSDVVSITPKGRTQLTFTLRSEEGKISKRVMGRTRLVAKIQETHKKEPAVSVVMSPVPSAPVIQEKKISASERRSLRELAQIGKTCGCVCHSGIVCHYSDYIGNSVCIPLLADRMLQLGVI